MAWEQFSIAMQKFAKQYKEGESERFDTVAKPNMTIIMCVTAESPVSGSPDYVAYTGPAEQRHQLSSPSVPFCKLQLFHNSRNMGCVGKSLLL